MDDIEDAVGAAVNDDAVDDDAVDDDAAVDKDSTNGLTFEISPRLVTQTP